MGLLIAAGVGLAALGLVGYWAVVLSEGVYLGPRVVTWLYDRAAPGYDRIKDLDAADDARYLARPLLMALEGAANPLVLDVATGTGRAAVALLTEADFAGRVLGVDRSAGMLARAREKLAGWAGRRGLVRADAGCLPFSEGAFAAVICLEALEFTARPQQTLREMVRMLKPGGVLLTSNRVGWDCFWFPGRRCGRGRVEGWLRELGLQEVEREAWQVYYDLVWARKGTALNA